MEQFYDVVSVTNKRIIEGNVCISNKGIIEIMIHSLEHNNEKIAQLCHEFLKKFFTEQQKNMNYIDKLNKAQDEIINNHKDQAIAILRSML